MNRFLTFVKHEPKKYLGRWTVDYCDQILHTKIKLANEDHCGTCETIYVKHLETKKNKTKTDSARRYEEYINAAIRSRIVHTKKSTIDNQIEYYICMN